MLDEKFGGCYTFGDFDGNGSVDFYDVSMFFFCMQGPDAAYADGHMCLNGDADEDLDVDLSDFALLQQVYQP